MRKALEGFVVDDRRGERHDTQERDGVEIVERDDRGAECVYVVRDGKRKLIRRAGHDVEQLEHHFPVCPDCHEQHMVVGEERIEPGDCPRIGWSWTRGAPRYPAGGTRTLQTVSAEARSFNEGMAQLEREVRRR